MDTSNLITLKLSFIFVENDELILCENWKLYDVNSIEIGFTTFDISRMLLFSFNVKYAFRTIISNYCIIYHFNKIYVPNEWEQNPYL